MNEQDAAAICKALGDSNRLKIVELLSGGEKCACELLTAFDITQPTLSHHMSVLSECGIVSTRKDGKWCHYSLDCQRLAAFRDFIWNLRCDKGGCCQK